MRLDVLDPPDKTFKLQPFLLQSEFDWRGRSGVDHDPRDAPAGPGPLNLRVCRGRLQSHLRHGGPTSSRDWTSPGIGPPRTPVTRRLPREIDQTVLEVWTMSSVLAGTFRVQSWGAQWSRNHHQRQLGSRAWEAKADVPSCAGLLRPAAATAASNYDE